MRRMVNGPATTAFVTGRSFAASRRARTFGSVPLTLVTGPANAGKAGRVLGAYRIEVSPDAQSWHTVWATDSGDGGVDNDAFAPAQARFVRMVGVRRGTVFGYSLWELEVYSR